MSPDAKLQPNYFAPPDISGHKKGDRGMTTVAYRDGVLAADRLATLGDVRHAVSAKLTDLGSDGALAITGNVGDAGKLRDWLQTDRTSPRPDVGKEGRLIHVSVEGVVTIYEDGGSFVIKPIDGGGLAWGSGAAAATAAMLMGADAVRAVEIASMVDVYTGEGIESIDLTELQRTAA